MTCEIDVCRNPILLPNSTIKEQLRFDIHVDCFQPFRAREKLSISPDSIYSNTLNALNHSAINDMILRQLGRGSNSYIHNHQTLPVLLNTASFAEWLLSVCFGLVSRVRNPAVYFPQKYWTYHTTYNRLLSFESVISYNIDCKRYLLGLFLKIEITG